MEKIGDRIRYARKEKGYRQIDLANFLGLSGSAVGLIEVNKNNPTLENLLKISEICDVELDWLLKGQGPRKVLGEIKEKSQGNGDYKSELERVLEENEHLRQQVRALTRAINLMPEHLGKLKVADLQAGISKLLNEVSGSVTRQQLMLR